MEKIPRTFIRELNHVKEISGPNGYCIDTEEHEVVINWDTKPGTMNDIRDTEDVPDVEEPHGNIRRLLAAVFMCWKQGKH